jgi:hypothetical protein
MDPREVDSIYLGSMEAFPSLVIVLAGEKMDFQFVEVPPGKKLVHVKTKPVRKVRKKKAGSKV